MGATDIGTAATTSANAIDSLMQNTKNTLFSFFSFSREKEANEVQKDVDFLLWTPENPSISDKLYIGNLTALKQSHFNKDLPTRILIHGFEDTGTTGWVFKVRDSYFIKGRNTKVPVFYCLMKKTNKSQNFYKKY